ncbi:MAG TPA: MmgE/PrpD family protein [Burkholderiales bacterium]|nr:MmgE/PrpD family protein [Burkholderiales bacterium]
MAENGGRLPLARELAERVCAVRYEDLPPAVVRACRVAVLDTLGVMLAGSLEEAPRIVERVLGLGNDEGPCLIFGSARRARPLDAALVNGTAAHALDFDNTAKSFGGHASAVMVPALLAAAEAHGCSGRDVLLAHAVGYELGARLGRCVNPHHTEKGWHPTATLGVFAVAAACARLLALTAERTATALALAASLASGIKANFGTMTKPLHAGHCARSGLLAAALAREGFTANAAALEHRQGFFNVFEGEGHYDARRALEGWDEWEIVEPGASYKLYPCCYSTHAAVEAALNLVRRHGPFEARAIARVDIATPARGLAHTDRPAPVSGLDAKFSVQYCVARALLAGRIAFEHFEGEAHRDPEIREMLPRVHAAPYRGVPFAEDDPFDAELTVTLADGSRLHEKVDRPLGRSSENPIPPERLEAKFLECAARALGPQGAADACRAIGCFERLGSVRELTRLLEPAGRIAEAGQPRAARPEGLHRKERVK